MQSIPGIPVPLVNMLLNCVACYMCSKLWNLVIWLWFMLYFVHLHNGYCRWSLAHFLLGCQNWTLMSQMLNLIKYLCKICQTRKTSNVSWFQNSFLKNMLKEIRKSWTFLKSWRKRFSQKNMLEKSKKIIESMSHFINLSTQWVWVLIITVVDDRNCCLVSWLLSCVELEPSLGMMCKIQELVQGDWTKLALCSGLDCS